MTVNIILGLRFVILFFFFFFQDENYTYTINYAALKVIFRGVLPDIIFSRQLCKT